MDKLKLFLSNRTNLILLTILLLIIALSGFGVYKFFLSNPPPLEEVDLPFDPEGPYAQLLPRRDGHALVLNILRVSSYESIAYELSYQSQGSSADEELGLVDRGVAGTVNTKDKSSEYSQEILFGTCSQGFTQGASHCVFDKGVENGTLTLKIKKPRERKLYKMITTWHLQQPDVALGVITSADGHFTYRTGASKQELTISSWTIVNDLTGVPKLPQEKSVLGKVYSFNVPLAKTFPKGEVTLELSDPPPADAKLARFIEAKNSWEILDTKTEGSKLKAKAEGAGIFAVLVNSPNTNK